MIHLPYGGTALTVTPGSDGDSTVPPMLVAERGAEPVDGIAAVFGAAMPLRLDNPDGTLMAADMRVGTSTVAGVQANAAMPAPTAILSLDLPDADVAYQRGIAAGGASLQDPKDEPPGDRMGGCAKSAGNQWWVATRIENLSPEAMQRRMAER